MSNCLKKYIDQKLLRLIETLYDQTVRQCTSHQQDVTYWLQDSIQFDHNAVDVCRTSNHLARRQM